MQRKKLSGDDLANIKGDSLSRFVIVAYLGSGDQLVIDGNDLIEMYQPYAGGANAIPLSDAVKWYLQDNIPVQILYIEDNIVYRVSLT